MANQQLNECKHTLQVREEEKERLNQKIQSISQENTHLTEELRKKESQRANMVHELNQQRNQLSEAEYENDTMKRKSQTVIEENKRLHQEVEQAQ